MIGTTLLLALTLTTPLSVGSVEPGHAANPVYAELLEKGWTVGQTRVEFPAPSLPDGAPAEAERAALDAIAGPGRAAEFTRDSVTAPVIVRTHDLRTEGDIIRRADVWFVVHADLDAIDPDRLAAGTKDDQTFEAANMRFNAHRLTPAELAARHVEAARPTDRARDDYVRLNGRLLDRIRFDATDRVTATRTGQSWTVGSRTDPRFDADPTAPNRWAPVVKKGSAEETGPSRPYAGGAAVAKVSRLASVPGALLVEVHAAFEEPRAWFDGNPILRSKIALVAQDRVRSLRRDLARQRAKGKSQEGGGARKAPGA